MKGATNWPDFWSTYGIGVAFVFGAFLIAYQFVNPAPPKHITIATGAVDGAYHRFAERYAALLEHSGITLEVRSTAGSVANLALLNDPSEKVDLAFVQGGVEAQSGRGALVGLGSIFLEPVWVFHRADMEVHDLRDLNARRVYIGPDGSGTQDLALRLLAENGATITRPSEDRFDGPGLVAAFSQGRIDAAIVVASPLAGSVRALLAAEGVALMDKARVAAYARRDRSLIGVLLPRGTIDLVEDRPSRDTRLIAATAMLAARKTLHPALIDLVLEAADEVHSQGGVFEEAGAFPSPHHMNLPVSADAERFYEYGPPLLRRYLPFWAATLLDRLKVMLLPLVAVMLPLLRVTPPLYRWRVRRRIYRWYEELQQIDPDLQDHKWGATKLERNLSELDRMEREVLHVSVPLSYADQLYDLRLHIGLVRTRLNSLRDLGAE